MKKKGLAPLVLIPLILVGLVLVYFVIKIIFAALVKAVLWTLGIAVFVGVIVGLYYLIKYLRRRR